MDNKDRYTNQNSKLTEKGSVMMECALGMAFLIPTMFLMLDVGLALNKYAKLARVSYEGTRYAATVAGLEGGRVKNVGSVVEYTLPDSTAGTAADFTQQEVVRDRLVELVNINGFEADSANITTNYIKRDPANATQANPDIIRVDIVVNYVPITPFLMPIDLAVSTSGPYLYRERI